MSIVRFFLHLVTCICIDSYDCVALPKQKVSLHDVGALSAAPYAAELQSGDLKEISPITLHAALRHREKVTITLTTERRYKGLEGSRIERILQGKATFSSMKSSSHAAVSLLLERDNNGEQLIRILLEPRGSRTLSKRVKALTLVGLLRGFDSASLLMTGERQISLRSSNQNGSEWLSCVSKS
jgi:hypothetical protein